MPRPRPSRPFVAALGAAALLAASATACGSDRAAPGASGRTLVVATTTQLADFARVVGGDDVEVYGLLKPNLDAHDLELSPADLDALARAEVILENGLELDGWLHDAVEASGTDVTPVVTSDGVDLVANVRAEDDHDHEGHDHDGDGHEDHDEAEHEEEEHHADDGHDHDGEWNPHVWFSPANAKVMVDHVADALVAADPDATDSFRRRQAAYHEELDELDRWIEQQIDALPDRHLVTDHDAFAYYVERYGLTFVGSIIPSFDTAADISAADLNDLAEAIDEVGVKAIFTEQSLPPKSAEALARRTGVEVVSGTDGLYGDSLGPDGSAGDTYLKMMRHNTTSIVEHLR